MPGQPEYQKDYSLHAPAVLDTEVRMLKVAKLTSVLEDAGLLAKNNNIAVDIGCSGGFFINALAGYYNQVIGIDIDTNALILANQSRSGNNITLMAADSMKLPLSDNSVDLVICNHVYEHVPDSDKLFSEIYRVLKNGGACYFGAASRLTLVEPHYHLAFLSWLPKQLAHVYMRITGKGNYYYENLRTCWGIRKLVRMFLIKDYTLKIISDPDKFRARDLIKKGGILDKIPLFIWKTFYWFLPGYIYILIKQ